MKSDAKDSSLDPSFQQNLVTRLFFPTDSHKNRREASSSIVLARFFSSDFWKIFFGALDFGDTSISLVFDLLEYKGHHTVSIGLFDDPECSRMSCNPCFYFSRCSAISKYILWMFFELLTFNSHLLTGGKQMGIESLPEYEKTKCRELVTKKKFFLFNIFFCAPQRHSLTVPGIPQQFQPVGENLLAISQILTRMVRIWGIVSKFSDHLRSDLRSHKKSRKYLKMCFHRKQTQP